MKNWLPSLVIAAIVGVVFWLVYNASPLNQLWTVIVAIAFIILARLAYDFLVRANQQNQKFDPVTFVVHVVVAILVTWLLYVLGLTGAIGLGAAIFLGFFVTWLVVTWIAEQLNPQPKPGTR